MAESSLFFLKYCILDWKPSHGSFITPSPCYSSAEGSAFPCLAQTTVPTYCYSKPYWRNSSTNILSAFSAPLGKAGNRTTNSTRSLLTNSTEIANIICCRCWHDSRRAFEISLHVSLLFYLSSSTSNLKETVLDALIDPVPFLPQSVSIISPFPAQPANSNKTLCSHTLQTTATGSHCLTRSACVLATLGQKKWKKSTKQKIARMNAPPSPSSVKCGSQPKEELHLQCSSVGHPSEEREPKQCSTWSSQSNTQLHN